MIIKYILKTLLFILENSMYDSLTLIVAFFSLITSISVIIVEYRHNKKDEETRKIDMKANYYCYLLPEKSQSIKIPEYKTSIKACEQFYNILIIDDNNNEDLSHMLEVNLSFSACTNIYPMEVLTKKINLYYGRVEIDEDLYGLSNSINFRSKDNKFKTVYIDKDKNINFNINCAITDNVLNELNENLKNDCIIELECDLIFNTHFNVRTYGKYKIKWKLEQVEDYKYNNIIGLDEKRFKYEVYMMQYENTKIEYIDKNE